MNRSYTGDKTSFFYPQESPERSLFAKSPDSSIAGSDGFETNRGQSNYGDASTSATETIAHLKTLSIGSKVVQHECLYTPQTTGLW